MDKSYTDCPSGAADSERPDSGSEYATAAPNSPVSEHSEPAAFPVSRRTSFATSDCGSAVSQPQLTPVQTPTDVSDDSSDADSEAPHHRRRSSTHYSKQVPGEPTLAAAGDRAGSRSEASSFSAGTAERVGKPAAHGISTRRKSVITQLLPVRDVEPSMSEFPPACASALAALAAAAAATEAAASPSSNAGGFSFSRQRQGSEASMPDAPSPMQKPAAPMRGFLKSSTGVGARNLEPEPVPRHMSGFCSGLFEKGNRGLYDDYTPVHTAKVMPVTAQLHIRIIVLCCSECVYLCFLPFLWV